MSTIVLASLLFFKLCRPSNAEAVKIMRVLLFGCGYLGQRLATQLTNEGHRVFAVSRNPSRADDWKELGWETVVANAVDTVSLQTLPHVDGCVYAVGYDRTQPQSKETIYVDGVRNTLHALAGRCQHFVYVSSSSVYGQDDGSVVDANSECRPLTESGQICQKAEQIVEQSPLRTTIVRLSGIYGPNRLLTRIDQLKAGKPLGGHAEAWLNLIHVDDAAHVLATLATKPGTDASHRTYLLSDLNPVPRQDFYKRLAELTDAPLPTFDTTLPTRSGLGGLGKQCSSREVLADTGIELMFPSYETGLIDAVHRTPQP